MGSIFGWKCERCGAQESFMCGGGMLSLNEPEVVRRAGEGAFGPAMATLLRDGVPDGWSVFRSRVYYRCPACDATFEGVRLAVDDRSDGELAYTPSPGTCPACGEHVLDDAPMGEDDVFERCVSRAREGCPKCGSQQVSVTCGNWD